MNHRTYYPAIVGGWLVVFAVCAAAQTPATTTTEAPATGATSTPQQQQSAQTGAPAKAHHATKQHKAMHKEVHKEMHQARAKESNVSTAESEYRTALRRCVEGQAAQRDQCLDNAISRYGRS
jgi:hypothetical protein